MNDNMTTNGAHRGFLGILCLIVLCLVFFSIGNIFNSDEGVVLDGAWRIYNGDKLYADFFSYIAPGSYWWTWLSFVTLGPEYPSARIFSVLLLACSVAAIYYSTKLASGTKTTALLGAFLWLAVNILNVVVINHNNHSAYAASFVLLFMLLALKTRRPVFFLTAGLCAGLTILFLQTKGLLLAGALLLLLCFFAVTGRHALTSIFMFGGGALLFPLMTFATWEPVFLYETLLRWPLEHYVAVNEVSKTPLYAIGAVSALSIYMLWRLRDRAGLHTDTLLLLAVIHLALLISTASRADLSHLALSGFIFLIVVALLFQTYMTPLAQRLKINYALLGNCVLFPLLVILSIHTMMAGVSAFWTAENFRQNVRERYVPEKIYAHPFLPGMYFEMGTRHSYRYASLHTGMYPEEAFLDNLQTLIREDPRYIFVNYNMVEKFGHDLANPLDQYILDHYVQGDQWYNMKILQKVEGGGAK